MAASSRESLSGAGWQDQEPGTYRELMPARVEKLSWLNPGTLWKARNGPLASLFGDPTGRDRSRWVAAEAARRGGTDTGAAAGSDPAAAADSRSGADPADDLVIARDDPDTFSFLLIGDTGEGDGPQYAVIPGLLEAGAGTRFAVVCSDVLYPVGNANEYGPKFFRPYRDYAAPIYAIPGNHDWYDGLTGFMRVFCRAPALPPAPRPRPLTAAWWRTLLWASPQTPDDARLDEERLLRGAPSQQASQPGPYWAIDAGPLRIVGIDTGLLGDIDREQGDWLRRVSAGDRPKILVTGSPIYVDGEHHPCAIEGGGTVDEIVTDPAHHYVAAIGGDIHNYQHYPVDVAGRRIEYVVSGGGGAFMHATHTIPRVDIGGVTEENFRCYPLRGDSLAFYSRLYGRRLRLRKLFDLHPDEASAVVARRLGTTPVRSPGAVGPSGSAGTPGRRARFVASVLGVPPRPQRRGRVRLPVRKTLTGLLSPASATYDPPFFKSFLRLDVSPGAVRVRCFAATGMLGQEQDPPVEDEFTITLPTPTQERPRGH
ncbi:metallophosphoesterase [Actinacidiphila sp. DG2A-62]|uniref:metallophosphoesterase family protein n=1 Tax=Actinacidiphila sp. DG2A-62 TaxID=3108821 RepID=UPI002DB63059|nr:metallophosphoesterase [Actinacidiphila sp. DG2A-62]MEC3992586.1 metallophosphoesterase [Actinacidiphila sp. DG2A-62]